jgi:hypothetical protein
MNTEKSLAALHQLLYFVPRLLARTFTKIDIRIDTENFLSMIS